LQVWDLAQRREPRQLDRLGGPVVSLALSRDGTTVAAACGDNSLRLWDLASGKELHSFDGHPGGLTAVVLSPNGRTVISAGKDRTIRLWETATGQRRCQLRGHGGWIEALALSPDGRVLAAGCSDTCILLWDLVRGKKLAQLMGHRGAIKVLAFSSRPGALASGSTDTTVLLWDVSAALRGARTPSLNQTPDQLTALWAELASADAEKAYQAVQTLTAAGDASVAVLKGQLRPVCTDQLTRLLIDLDSDSYAVRERATRELAAQGRSASPTLQKALKGNPSLEVKRRIEGLLARLRDVAPSPDLLRGLRSVEVLESIGTPQAQTLLRQLAAGAPEGELTREARAALARLAGTSRPAH
jgi:hypothetical protein